MGPPIQDIKAHLLRKRKLSNNGCWLWCGATSSSGYGSISRLKKISLVHRISYEAFVGPIPVNTKVLHKCDVKSCFNPAHLFLGTQKDNVRDMDRKNRRNAPVGEQHYKAKLTNRDVLSIRKQRKLGASLSSLSQKYNVSSGHISLICLKKTWRHI